MIVSYFMFTPSVDYCSSDSVDRSLTSVSAQVCKSSKDQILKFLLDVYERKRLNRKRAEAESVT